MDVIHYLRDILGFEVSEGANLDSEKGSLPYYLRIIPDQEIFICGKRVILEYKKNLKNSTPDQLDNQRRLFENNFNAPVVFCFKRLEAYERKRLIERKISFIEIGKQLYIPSLMMSLNEFKSRQAEKRKTLSPITQLLLFYHIQSESLDGKLLGSIPSIIKSYTLMSVSRAAKELESAELCVIEGVKSKVLKFQLPKKKLWEAALPLLSSPIKKKLYFKKDPSTSSLIKSGDAALSFYSSLAESNFINYAISERSFKNVMAGWESLPTRFGGSYCIEIWKYDPVLLAKDNIADPLSLYLCYGNDVDERIEKSLQELIEHVKW